MNQFGGELAALQHQRTMDEATSSPLVEELVEATVSIAENVGLPLTGLIRRALASGKVPVERMIDNLESAVDEEIKRIWKYLRDKEKQQEEFAARLRSQEAQSVYLTAFFHGLRTSDPGKHRRLGRLTVNCIFVDDLKPESLDGMMRAVVELTEWDAFVLGKMYSSQKHLLSSGHMSFDWSEQVGLIWTGWNGIFGIGEDQQLRLRSALTRLQSLGFVAEAQTHFVKDGSLASQAFGLLPDGARFFERIQEISAGH